MIGNLLKGGARLAMKGTTTTRGIAPYEKMGMLLGRVAGPKAGFVAAKSLKGAAVGGLVGGALWGITGNSGWMSLGVGTGAWMGGARAIQSIGRSTFAGGGRYVDANARWATQRGPIFGLPRELPSAYRRVKAGPATTMTSKAFGSAAGAGSPMSFGWFNPGRLGRNMAIGGAAGLYFDDPNMAIYGAVGLPAARWGAKMMFEGAGAGAAKFFGARGGWANMSFIEGGSFGTVAGLVGGGAYGGYKLATGMRSSEDVAAGYFPGGVSMLGPGGGAGISNNHLNTEGLTLALHKNARRTRVM